MNPQMDVDMIWLNRVYALSKYYDRDFITEFFAPQSRGITPEAMSAWCKLVAELPDPAKPDVSGAACGWLLEALERAVDASVACMPDLPGRTAVMLDISGSMQGQYLAAGSVLALSLLKKTGGRGRFMLFDTESEDVRVEADEPILRAAGRICARGGTDTGVCLERMIAQNDRCDTLIIVTDEQQNAGSPFYKRLRDYRYKVNKDARAFVVDVSPYGSAMTPPSDGKTWYCFGWSDQVVSFIAQAVQGYGDLVSRVSAIELGGESGAACA